MMGFKPGDYLSTVIASRRKYRFFGFVIGRLCIGFSWPTAKAAPMESKNQLVLPGIEEAHR